VLVGALAGGGAAYWRWRTSHKTAPMKYETETVDRGMVAAKITASGTVSSLVTVQVGSQVSGRISDLFVDYNQRVTKGMVLAKLDPATFEAALQQAQANEVAARANLTRARVLSVDADRQYQRSKDLADRKLVALADRDTAQANADSARAQVIAAQGEVTQAEASRHMAEVNLAYTTIVSPIDGVVISRSVDRGQTVAASFQAPVLFTIAQDLAKMQVDTSVAEADVGKLTPGMTADFVVFAYPEEHFKGRVRQIRNAAQTVQSVVTYDAVIDVDNPDLKLRPGMTANVTFTVAQKDDTLRVPNSALRFRAPASMQKEYAAEHKARREHDHEDGGGDAGPRHHHKSENASESASANANGGSAGSGSGNTMHASGARGSSAGADDDEQSTGDRRTVWVLREGKPSPVHIKIGITDGTTTEIVEGDLKEGDLVITDATGGAAGSSKKGGGGGGGAMRRMF
jgi:HlyD family secretion protein